MTAQINQTLQPIFQDGGAGGGLPGAIFSNRATFNAFHENWKKTIGPEIQLFNMGASGDYDTHHSMHIATQGIPMIMDGRARYIEAELITHQATSPDPINYILARTFTDALRIIFSQEELLPGMAVELPERTAAPTVTTRYKSWEVKMRRYGKDAIFNTNAFLKPDAAKKEFDNKMLAIKIALERTDLHMAWLEVIRNAHRLSAILQLATPANQHLTPRQRMIEADREFARTQAGALHFPHGLKQLIDMQKKASSFHRPRSTNSPLMVVPAHIGLLEDTKPERLVYSVSGLTADETTRSIVGNVAGYSSKELGDVKVAVYDPPIEGEEHNYLPHELTADMRFGVVALEKIANHPVSTKEDDDDEDKCAPCIVTNFVDADWLYLPRAALPNVTLTPFGSDQFDVTSRAFPRNRVTRVNKTFADILKNKNTEEYNVGWLSLKTLLTQHGVLSWDPGYNTGEIATSFPVAKPARDEVTDSARVMVRQRSGVVIKDARLLSLLESMRFVGMKTGFGNKYCTSGKYKPDEHAWVLFATKENPLDPEALWEDKEFIDQMHEYGLYEHMDLNQRKRPIRRDRINDPYVFYRATQRTKKGAIRCKNNGHMRETDHPDNSECLVPLCLLSDSTIVFGPVVFID